MRRAWKPAFGCVLLAGLVSTVGAEVSVRTDKNGKFVAMQVVPGGPHNEHSVWSLRTRRPRATVPLNPRGDSNGDLWPSVVESPQAPYHPWVAWSRFNGSSYDLAWSRWTERGWVPIQLVDASLKGGDELDPDISFDQNGRPYMVWWREEGGRGRVYISVFLATRWMEPLSITSDKLDSRYPVVQVGEAGSLIVEFETQAGRVSQSLSFTQPVTITDDINPQSIVTLTGEVTYLRKKR